MSGLKLFEIILLLFAFSPHFAAARVLDLAFRDKAKDIISQQCARHEHFSECPPPNEACEPHCPLTRVPRNAQCELDVCGTPRCVCKHGFVRNFDGFCVRRSRCHLSSGPRFAHIILDCWENEHYSDCGPTHACELSCENLDNPPNCPPLEPEQCFSRCACNEGYVRNEDRKCVPMEHCPSIERPRITECPLNSHYTDCGPQSDECERSCMNINSGKTCVAACGPPKCVCNDGYVKTAQGECVRESNCEMMSGVVPEQATGMAGVGTPLVFTRGTITPPTEEESSEEVESEVTGVVMVGTPLVFTRGTLTPPEEPNEMEEASKEVEPEGEPSKEVETEHVTGISGVGTPLVFTKAPDEELSGEQESEVTGVVMVGTPLVFTRGTLTPPEEPDEVEEPSKEVEPEGEPVFFTIQPDNEIIVEPEPEGEASKEVEPEEPSEEVEPEGEPSKEIEPVFITIQPDNEIIIEPEPEGEPSKEVEPEGEPSKEVEPKESSKEVEPEGEPSKEVETEGELSKEVQPEGEPTKEPEIIIIEEVDPIIIEPEPVAPVEPETEPEQPVHPEPEPETPGEPEPKTSEEEQDKESPIIIIPPEPEIIEPEPATPEPPVDVPVPELPTPETPAEPEETVDDTESEISETDKDETFGGPDEEVDEIVSEEDEYDEYDEETGVYIEEASEVDDGGLVEPEPETAVDEPEAAVEEPEPEPPAEVPVPALPTPGTDIETEQSVDETESEKTAADCGLHEIYKICGPIRSDCEVTCANRKSVLPCPAECGPPKCMCRTQFLRNSLGQCILEDRCPETDQDETPGGPDEEVDELVSGEEEEEGNDEDDADIEEGADVDGGLVEYIGCSVEINSHDSIEGVIHSPRWPQFHPGSNVECRGISYTFVSSSPRLQVQILFHRFNLFLPENERCEESEHDHVTAYTGMDQGRVSQIGERLCGSFNPLPLMSSHGHLSLDYVIHSKEVIEDQNDTYGFEFKYRFVMKYGLRYDANVRRACHFVFNSSDAKSGSIHSPNYPGLYPRDLDCEYEFFGMEDEVVKVVFTYFDVEGYHQCGDDSQSDYVSFSNYKTTDRVFPRYCGKNIPLYPNEIQSESNYFRIMFHTGEVFDATGFYASYQFIDPKSIERLSSSTEKTLEDSEIVDIKVPILLDCNYAFIVQGSETDGIISSPSYPENYPPDTHCKYEFFIDENQQVSITFDEFDVAGSENCESGDYISVKFSKEDDSPMIYCTDAPPTIQSTSTYLSIEFHSDGDNQGKGFEAKYQFTLLEIFLPSCDEEKYVGDSDCEGVEPKIHWYFAEEHQQCLAFEYSGCGGNSNRFKTYNDCTSRCIPADGGVCSGNHRPALDQEGNGIVCEDVSECPPGFSCDMGAFFAQCCNASIEAMYRRNYNPKCEDGSEVVPNKDINDYSFPLLGGSCADNFCPEESTCHDQEAFSYCCVKAPHPILCVHNEEFMEDGPCDPGCSDEESVCTEVRLGCRCQPEFVRHNGACILKDNCPDLQPEVVTPAVSKECGDNEEWNECSGCELDCSEGPAICTADCKPPSCQCKTGFVRHEGSCIDKNDCPNTDLLTAPPNVEICGENERWIECSSCEASCNTEATMCTRECKPPKCQCEPGFLRHEGSCIAENECPPPDHPTPAPGECGPNENFVECAGCEEDCYTGLHICTLECKPPQCQCDSGFVRHEGSCIAKEECPNKQCGLNEKFFECARCEEDCSTGPEFCTDDCKPPQCQCDYSFVRHEGNCIEKKDCPTINLGVDEEPVEELDEELLEEIVYDSEAGIMERELQPACDLPCKEGCYPVFDDQGCSSCECRAADIESPCDDSMCPGHCPVTRSPETGCQICSCSPEDLKVVYTIRLPVMSSMPRATYLCIDYAAGENLTFFESQTAGKMTAQVGEVSQGNRKWATLDRFGWIKPVVNSDQLNRVDDVAFVHVEKNALPQCPCEENLPDTITFLRWDCPDFRCDWDGGEIGNLTYLLTRAVLKTIEGRGLDLQEMELVLEEGDVENERKVPVSYTQRLNPVTEESYDCYRVDRNALSENKAWKVWRYFLFRALF